MLHNFELARVERGLFFPVLIGVFELVKELLIWLCMLKLVQHDLFDALEA